MESEIRRYTLPMVKVEEIMAKNVIAVEKSKTIEELVKNFRKYEFHSFPVTEEGKLVGIVTKTDLLKIISSEKMSAVFASCVEDIMTPNPITISPEAYLVDAINIMKKNRIRILPVVENEKMVGILSYSDLVRVVFKE